MQTSHRSNPATGGDTRAKLHADLESARATFHATLDSVPTDAWMRRGPESAWTVRELFVHLAWALEQLPKEVVAARQGKGMFNAPKWVSDPGSYWLIRWLARGASPESVRRRYDAAIDAAIAALRSVPDADWSLGAPFYGEGFHAVSDLFSVPLQHLAEHTAFLSPAGRSGGRPDTSRSG